MMLESSTTEQLKNEIELSEVAELQQLPTEANARRRKQQRKK